MPGETREVHVAEGVTLYTGLGQIPFAPGEAFHLRADHADELLEAGHLQTPEEVEAAEAEAAQAADTEAAKTGEAEKPAAVDPEHQ